MPTTKTFTFATTSDGWTFTSGGNATGTFTSGDGNPAGSLLVSNLGRNKVDVNGYWSWTGTFEDLGVPSGDTVTGYSAASFDHKCSVWNVVDSASIGPLDINDGTARTLVTAQSFTGTTAWATKSNSPAITGLSLASTTSVTIYIYDNLDNGNNVAAQVDVGADNISITIEHETPSNPTTVTPVSDTLAVTEGTLTVQADVDTNVSLSSQSLSITEGTVTVSLASATEITLLGASLSLSAGTLSVQADVDTNVSLTPVSMSLSAGTLDVSALTNTNVTLIADSLSITGGTVNVDAFTNTTVTLVPDSLTLSEGTLTIGALTNTNVTLLGKGCCQ